MPLTETQYQPMLWIIGSESDPHVAALRDAAVAAKIKVRVFGPNGSDLFASLPLPACPKRIIWRLKRYSDEYIRSLPDAIAQFSELEWREALRGLCEVSGAPILNGPIVIARAGSKPYQLKVASDAGLRVPKHVISNDQNTLTKFFESNSSVRVIRKPLGSTHIPSVDDFQQTEFLSPSFVTSEEIANAPAESIKACPIFLQEYVEKAYELRIIMAGRFCLAFKVDSQASTSTQIDWRRDIMRDMYSIVVISAKLQQKLRSYLDVLGLFSGVFDFVVKNDGSEVFLECNPNGQWLWLDELAPGAIQSAFVSEAMRDQPKGV